MPHEPLPGRLDDPAHPAGDGGARQHHPGGAALRHRHLGGGEASATAGTRLRPAAAGTGCARGAPDCGGGGDRAACARPLRPLGPLRRGFPRLRQWRTGQRPAGRLGLGDRGPRPGGVAGRLRGAVSRHPCRAEGGDERHDPPRPRGRTGGPGTDHQRQRDPVLPGGPPLAARPAGRPVPGGPSPGDGPIPALRRAAGASAHRRAGGGRAVADPGRRGTQARPPAGIPLPGRRDGGGPWPGGGGAGPRRGAGGTDRDRPRDACPVRRAAGGGLGAAAVAADHPAGGDAAPPPRGCCGIIWPGRLPRMADADPANHGFTSAPRGGIMRA